MTDDDLRARLAAANPAPPSDPVDPVTSERAQALMEDIMSTDTSQPTAERQRPHMMLAVAAALVVFVGGAILFESVGETDAPVVLTAEGGDALASCLPFEVATLAEMSPAFAGTVTELTDRVATLEVDRWFTGGDAELVEVHYTPGFEALIGTPQLQVGQRYLITASDDVVNGCGYSGPATPEYEAAFEEAFGA